MMPDGFQPTIKESLSSDVLRTPFDMSLITQVSELALQARTRSRDDYLLMSGGKKRVEDNRICGDNPNGCIDIGREGEWFGSSVGGIELRGAVVPLDAARMRPLPMWTAIATIFCSIAIAAAAVNGL